jgi:DNA-nicking Smr family endonuclease
MIHDGGSRRRGPRGLSDDERTLWRTVARSVAPLKKRPRPESLDDLPNVKPAKAAPATRAAAGKPRAASPAASSSPPALAPIDRRTRQKLARGTLDIDARLDLHGLTQAQAHMALLRFLRHAQNDGARVVLVITGKGGAAENPYGGRGVLRRQVPLWLSQPEFRVFVVSADEARAPHGGAGALYLRLRRSR